MGLGIEIEIEFQVEPHKGKFSDWRSPLKQLTGARLPPMYRFLVPAVLAVCAGGIQGQETPEPAALREFEQPAILSAREWWNNALWLDSSLWRVHDEIHPEDFTNHYDIDSSFGPMEAWSDQHLLARLNEILAISWLREQGVGRSSGRGFQELATSKIQAVESLAVRPVNTVFDVPRGARAIIRRMGSFKLEERRQGNYSGGGPLRGMLGANDRKRSLAAELRVDPYSDNPVLQEELARVALLEAIPDFSVELAIPGSGLFDLLDTAKEVRTTDAYLASPSDLFLQNRKSLLENAKAPEALVAEFLSLPFCSPAQQTILARSLASVSTAEHREVLVALAAASTTRQEFDFYRRTTELLAWYQMNREPIAKLETLHWLPVAVTASGKRILPLAVDLGGWFEDCASILSEFASGQTGCVVVLKGRLTPRAQTELRRRGVEVVLVDSDWE